MPDPANFMEYLDKELTDVFRTIDGLEVRDVFVPTSRATRDYVYVGIGPEREKSTDEGGAAGVWVVTWAAELHTFVKTDAGGEGLQTSAAWAWYAKARKALDVARNVERAMTFDGECTVRILDMKPLRWMPPYDAAQAEGISQMDGEIEYTRQALT